MLRLRARAGAIPPSSCFRPNLGAAGQEEQRPMRNAQKGFTLIELMIVVVIIGILAAIAIPNFIAMQNRAKEGSTKANMHTLQLAAEDYGVAYDGVYAATMTTGSPLDISNRLPGNFKT